MASKEQKIAAFDPSGPGHPDAGIYGMPFTAEESDIIILPVPWEGDRELRRGRIGWSDGHFDGDGHCPRKDTLLLPTNPAIGKTPSSGRKRPWKKPSAMKKGEQTW